MNETRTKAIILTAVIVALLLASIIGIVYYRRISSVGIIKAVGVDVFWDVQLTEKATDINWGAVEPGKETNRSVYIKSTSNVPVNLILGTESWNPSVASDYLTLYWDYQNQTLMVNEVILTTFTLAVAANVTGITTFSFVIVIIAHG